MLSEDTGFTGRNYLTNIVIAFDYTEDNSVYFPPVPPIDQRHHPKEMVFGLARGGGTSIAFLYSDLARVRVVNQVFDDSDIVIFYEPQGQLAQGHLRHIGDRLLHFDYADDADDNGLSLFVDTETGSTWNLKGVRLYRPDNPVRSRHRSTHTFEERSYHRSLR